jgi:hypothetical protein
LTNERLAGAAPPMPPAKVCAPVATLLVRIRAAALLATVPLPLRPPTDDSTLAALLKSQVELSWRFSTPLLVTAAVRVLPPLMAMPPLAVPLKEARLVMLPRVVSNVPPLAPTLTLRTVVELVRSESIVSVAPPALALAIVPPLRFNTPGSAP